MANVLTCNTLSPNVAVVGCVQVETEEDETTLEQLRALTKVFVPEKVQDDFMEVSRPGGCAGPALSCWQDTNSDQGTSGWASATCLVFLCTVPAIHLTRCPCPCTG